MTRRKEEFEPIHPGYVTIYVCGPTIYDHAHIGHAKVYVSFDMIVRYLRYLGYKVRYVQNITDVGHLTDDADDGEDKILKRAARDRVEPMELVETYMRSYFEDMDALNVVRPNISPRPSCHISEQIALAESLLERDHAYEVNGSVYFDVSSWPEYGKLSGDEWRNKKKAPAWQSIPTSVTQPTLPSGRKPNRVTSCAGQAPGVGAIPAGTSSAR